MILIDADRLRDKLKEVAHDRFNLSDEYGWFLKGLLAADDEIMSFPDAIEIIRCKDCKYGEYREDFGDYECGASGLGLVYEPEFFCADGERREDAETD